MLTIGILGGLGPQATMDFEDRIHALSQRLIPQGPNGTYPPMVVYYFRHPPVLMGADQTAVLPIQPDPRLMEAASKLGAWADFLVISSNTPHLFRKEIEKASGRFVLSMIDVTLDELKRRQWNKIGVVGMGTLWVYLTPLGELGFACESVSEELGRKLNQAILALMRGQAGSAERVVAREAIVSLRAKNVDGIVLGCTEIPLLLQEKANAPDLINPAQLLAEAAVRYALE